VWDHSAIATQDDIAYAVKSDGVNGGGRGNGGGGDGAGGAWRTVVPVANTFVVNCGDYFSMLSGGIFASPLHRVITRETEVSLMQEKRVVSLVKRAQFITYFHSLSIALFTFLATVGGSVLLPQLTAPERWRVCNYDHIFSCSVHTIPSKNT
jgi:hypothetical protein